MVTVGEEGTEQQDISKFKFKHILFPRNSQIHERLQANKSVLVHGAQRVIIQHPSESKTQKKKRQLFHSNDYCAQNCASNYE